MPKKDNDDTFDDIVYWSDRLTQLSDELRTLDLVNLPHKKPTIQELHLIRETVTSQMHVVSLLNNVVKTEIIRRKNRNFFQRLFHK